MKRLAAVKTATPNLIYLTGYSRWPRVRPFGIGNPGSKWAWSRSQRKNHLRERIPWPLSVWWFPKDSGTLETLVFGCRTNRMKIFDVIYLPQEWTHLGVNSLRIRCSQRWESRHVGRKVLFRKWRRKYLPKGLLVEEAACEKCTRWFKSEYFTELCWKWNSQMLKELSIRVPEKNVNRIT